MRKAIAGPFFAIAATGFVSPAAAKVVLFKGVLGVQAASSACGILPYIEQDALYRATYRPARVGDNGPSTSLILMPTATKLTDLLVSSFTLPNARFDIMWSPVDVSVISSNSLLSLGLKQYTARMRMIQQTPANLNAARFVELNLQIHGFGGVAACTVTMHGFVGVNDSLTAG